MASIGILTRKSVPVRLLFILLCAAALLSRLMPLWFSQYPFNNDSLTEAGIAEAIVDSGRLEETEGSPWQISHSLGIPAFNIVIAWFSVVTGIEPLMCVQALTAIFSVATVGGFFVLGRVMTGRPEGGLAAAFCALMFGTFVFTTGSAWKEALGIAVLVLLLISYLQRTRIEFRILTLTILLVLPFIHHLVAAVGYLAMAFLVAWSWMFALSHSTLGRRHYNDALTVLPPIALGIAYYAYESFNRLETLFSDIGVFLFLSSFVLLTLVAFLVMSLRTHVKWTFAPLVGGSFLVVLLLDYYGYLFPYTPSASDLYLVLLVASSVVIAFGWYGSEIVLETRLRYRAVHLALLVSPLTLILFSIAGGLSPSSHQVVYRTFDFFDFFLFIGIGAAFADSRLRAGRLRTTFGVAAVVCVAATFPFGYFTADTLGVRHDTQVYEIDLFEWISDHDDDPTVVSDERLAYIANSTIWVEKRAYLPHDLLTGMPPLPEMYYVIEDSWMTLGVNDFPSGRAVIPYSVFFGALEESNVVYVSGPKDDRAWVYYPYVAPLLV